MLTAIIIAVVLIAFCIGLIPVYHKTFYSPHKGMSETQPPDFLTGHPYRDVSRGRVQRLSHTPCTFVTTRSYDGLTLSARYYKGAQGKPLCICFHGYRGSAVRDWSGVGLYLIDQGYSVLLVDERAHWRSGGHTITYGIRERKDVLSWIDYARDRFGDTIPLYLFGISMGGATVLMASGEPLPEQVRGIIADCPYNAPKDIIRFVCRLLKLNPTVCWPLIRLSALLYGRLNINAVSAAEQVRKADKPILILHGEKDGFVPAAMSQQVKDAHPAIVEYHTFPKADHGLSYYADSERYQAIVDAFLQKHP